MEDRHGARSVLSWAITWALKRGARLDVLTSRPEGAATRERTAAVRTLIGTCLDEHGGARIPVSLYGTTEPAGPALVRSAHGADLLVVGVGERARSGRRRPGPVLAHCLTRAECPVLVAPSTGEAGTIRWSIAVGVDGSARSRTALRRARWEAATPGDLTVVTVVDDKHGWPRDQSWTRPIARVRRDREDLQDMNTDTGTLTITPRPRHDILPGRPVGVLTTQLADLLVVGAPARRSEWGWLPTSTVRRCLAHRDGAVMMVPFAERASR
ncbi:universal stress protein [Klenkia soli]|nr:universal stress protein [Klenkia soli]